LTGRTANHAIHDSTPRIAVEGGNVIPYRRVIQGLVFHPRHESGRGEGLPLDVAHSTGSTGEFESEVEAAVPREERQAVGR
jgi:hypothetical protein